MKPSQAYEALAKAIHDAPTIPPCQTSDPDAWFSTWDEDGASYAIPRKLCQSCPVQKECLTYALAANEQFGLWGGLTTRQRNALKSDGRVRGRGRPRNVQTV